MYPKPYILAGDLFEKVEDISLPHIWQSSSTFADRQYMMRRYIINLADFIVPGHGPMFRVTDDMRNILSENLSESP